MVNHVGGWCRRREQLEDACVSASTQRNNLFLLSGTVLRLEEARNEVIDCSRSNVGPYRNWPFVRYHPTRTRTLQCGRIPLLIMGYLLVSNPGGVNACAKGSSRYPNRTALSRDTLASLSVPCTTRSLEDAVLWAPWLSEPPPPRDLNRPGPPLLRRVLRLGI